VLAADPKDGRRSQSGPKVGLEAGILNTATTKNIINKTFDPNPAPTTFRQQPPTTMAKAPKLSAKAKGKLPIAPRRSSRASKETVPVEIE
jgi:hypothetical protein